MHYMASSASAGGAWASAAGVGGSCSSGIQSFATKLVVLDKKGASNEEALDKDAYAALLRQCGNGKALAEGRRVHARIAGSGHDRETFLGNLIVQMYGKCGSLEDAKLVFARIHRRTVYSWSIMVQACVQNGQGREALELLRQMDFNGIKSDTITFISILSACTKLRALAEGKAVHARMVASGIPCDDVVGNALLNMYGKCGAIEDARRVFEKMSQRNVISWSTIIAAYALRGHCKEALALFQRMETDGVQPNEVTFLSVLEACANAEALEEGKAIHCLAVKTDMDTGLIVGTALVSMYGRCGCLEDARHVFDRMPERDVVTWNAMISAYAQFGHCKEVLQLLRHMNLDGLKPNDIVLMSILGACSSVGALAEGKVTHQLIVASGFGSDVSIGNTLIRMYGKCGDLDAGRSVFRNMLRRDVVSWSAMIAAFAEHGHCKEAFKHFQQMDLEGVKPDYVTFVSLLDACSTTGDLAEGEAIHARIRASGYGSEIVLANSLINMYGKCGSLQDARGVFEQMPRKNVVSWTSIITAYLQHEDGKEALELFGQMESQGVEANAVTFVAALDACCISGALEEGRAIHGRIASRGIESDRVWTSLVDMYGKCGSLDEARNAFARIRGRCVPAWNAMIGAYAQGVGHVAESRALYYYRNMNLDGVKPNDITFVTVLSAWSGFRDLQEVREVHGHILASGFESDIVISTVLVHIYGKCGSLDDARQVFDRMQQKDVVSWNAILGAYARHGYGRDALELYQQMELEPNETTFMSILEACACTGSIARGREIHACIAARGFDSDVHVATSLVNMYGKCGRLHEAKLVFDEVRQKTVVSWTALIAAYAQHGHCTEALELFQEMDLEGMQPDEVTFLSIVHACSHSGLLDEGRSYFLTMIEDHNIVPLLDHFVCIIDLLGRSGRLNEAEELLQCMPFQPGVVAWNTLLAACKTHNDSERAARIAEDYVLKFRPKHAGPYISVSNIYSTSRADEKHQENSMRKLAA